MPSGVTAFDHKVVTAYRWPVDVVAARFAAAGFVELERRQHSVPDHRTAGTPPLPHGQPGGLSGLVVALAVTAVKARRAAGRVGVHLRDADVLHDVTQVVHDRVPVVVGGLLVAVREPDEAEAQLLRDLLVVVGVTDHQHAPWVVTRGPEPARDDVGLGCRVRVGDPEDLVEVTRDGVGGHLGVEHVRDGCGDEDLFHTQTPDRGEGGISPGVQLS